MVSHPPGFYAGGMRTMTRSEDTSATPIGALLREWRAARRLSQLDLALAADISTRHLSCVETGKAQASRETIARLADALDMPLRERNALLLAAGFAPTHPESALGTPDLAPVRRAIDFILAQQEPYPAFVLNRHWDILMANAAATRVNALVMGGRTSAHGRPSSRRRSAGPIVSRYLDSTCFVAEPRTTVSGAVRRMRRAFWARSSCGVACEMGAASSGETTQSSGRTSGRIPRKTGKRSTGVPSSLLKPP